LLAASLAAGPIASAQPAPDPEPPVVTEEASATEDVDGEQDEGGDALDALDDKWVHPMVIPDFSRQPQSPEIVGRPQHRWIWRNLFAARLNPLGLVNRFQTGWRTQLLDKPGPLYDESQASLLFHSNLSPAMGEVGARVEFQPLSVLRFAATYAFVGSMGLFDFVQPFDSPDEEFDDDTLDDRKDLNIRTTGHYLEPSVLVQAKVGSIAVRNETKWAYRYFAGVDNDQYFWDPVYDVMFPNNGWIMTNDTDLLYLFDFGLTVGARWTYTNVFYREGIDQDGPAADNAPLHRLGPAILYKFFEDPAPTRWNAPTVGVLAQWWLKHRYRTGKAPAAGLEDRSVTQAYPYILLLFIQKGDFFPTAEPSE
jgi:hypothetical protein